MNMYVRMSNCTVTSVHQINHVTEGQVPVQETPSTEIIILFSYYFFFS